MDPSEAVFGSSLPRAQSYVALLTGSAVEQGLLGPGEAPRIWERHILNCAVLSPAVPQDARLADVGSGAGLPGIVLAIARPDLRVTLIEPLLRRATWLQTAVEQLSLSNVEVVRARAEDLAVNKPAFDVVTARAVAALPKLAGWCLPLLRPGGLFLALKGQSAASELAQAEPLLRSMSVRSWQLEELGADVLETPARVIRMIAGSPGHA